MKKFMLLVCLYSIANIRSAAINETDKNSAGQNSPKIQFMDLVQIRPGNLYRDDWGIYKPVYTGNEALLEAATKGDLKTAQAALDDIAWVNTTNKDNQTPLLLAVAKENLAMVNLLLKCHADIDASDKWGNTPWNLAISKDNKDIINALRDSSKRRNLQALVIAEKVEPIDVN